MITTHMPWDSKDSKAEKDALKAEKLERLRDELAMSFNCGEFDLATAEIVMGCKRPGFDSYNLDVINWWLEAESKYRYMYADRMLATREQKQ